MTGKRILYIEDNSDNRLLIKRVLEAEGYTVVEAETGIKGLELAASTQPDLVLMDINLPEIDGYECTQRLRKVPGGDKIPIIALTANAMEGDAQKALDAGCNGHIPKPIDVDHLPSQVEKYLKAASTVAQPASAQPQHPPSMPTPAPTPQPAASPSPVTATPAANVSAPSSSGPGAPAPGSPAPATPAPGISSPSAPMPASPGASIPVSGSPNPGTPAPSVPATSPSPQPPNTQGQTSQAPGVQTPNPQNQGSQH